MAIREKLRDKTKTSHVQNTFLCRVEGVQTAPLYVKPQISYKNGTGHVTILVGEKLPNKIVDGITLVVPLPKAVATCDLAANCGSVHYDAASKASFAIDILKV